METADHEVLRVAADWLDDGAEVYLATLIHTFGTAPRAPGAIAALRADGRMAGSLSGGCIEYDLVARIREGRLDLERPARVRYGVTNEDAMRFGLPCGGKLELLVERLDAARPLREILAKIETGVRVRREVCLNTGESRITSLLASASRIETGGTTYPAMDEDFGIDEFNLYKVFGPGWRLILIGAGQLSRFAAEFALALEYDVTVCEPRDEIARGWNVPGTSLDTRMPDDVVLALQHERTAVLALMHDPKLDDLALLEALQGPAFYVGALGSKNNNHRRRARLLSLGLTPEQVARLNGPVGLPIGSKTPAEIALAALAGVTAARHGIALDSPHLASSLRSVRV